MIQNADVVVDIGCATHGGDNSIDPLLEQYNPKDYYGFDPQERDNTYRRGATTVRLRRLAAWVDDDGIEMGGHGLGLGVRFDGGEYETYPTFDLARFLDRIAVPGRSVVLKLDAEGSEWQVVPHLVDQDVDVRLALMLVEWHCLRCGHGGWSHAEGCEGKEETEERARAIERTVRCPIERWEM